MPYIDLHFHLDGSVTPAIAKKLAVLQNLPLESDPKRLEAMLSLPPDCENLNDFLKCFALPLTLLQTKEGIREAVYLEQEWMKEQGVLYAEIRFAPQLHCDKGLSQKEVICAALEGLHKSDLPCNLILCCMRGVGNDAANEETLLLAEEFLCSGDKGDEGVVALDLAGAEGLFPTSDYEALFRKAVKKNIPFTIHAGEADGAESVWKALSFGAKRIGHGVRIAEDPALMEQIRRHGIFLEMCPTSNRQTKAVEDMTSYPLPAFLKQGIPVTVNTDDAAICRTTMALEMQYLKDSFGLSEDDLTQITKNSIEAAFTGEKTRTYLTKVLS